MGETVGQGSEACKWVEAYDPLEEPEIFRDKDVGTVVKIDKPILAYKLQATRVDLTIEGKKRLSPIRYVVEDRREIAVEFDHPKKVGSCRMLIIHEDSRPHLRYAFLCA